MGTLLAVRGVGNRGKTDSIRKLYQLLKTDFPGANVEELVIGIDIKVIFTIDGIKIGIESQGDPGSRLFSSLKQFVQLRCEVIVCATRSRGATVDAVTALTQQYHITWFEKASSSDVDSRSAANLQIARELLKAVRLAIGR